MYLNLKAIYRNVRQMCKKSTNLGRNYIGLYIYISYRRSKERAGHIYTYIYI